MSRIHSLTDLTRLKGDETTADIRALCDEAMQFQCAAVCVYPQYVEMIREHFPHFTRPIATVVNFPSGKEPLEKTLTMIHAALAAGATEIDVVLPHHLLPQNPQQALDYLQACRVATGPHCLKVIIESGELTPSLTQEACRLCLTAKADFIKTSTGKTAHGASLEAAEIILESIHAAHSTTGIKISGGIRSEEQALAYLALAEKIMGEKWIRKNTFRFGCSQIIEPTKSS